MAAQRFINRLKLATTGRDQTPLVLTGNFEVEQHWAVGEVSLPRLGSQQSAAIVNRMDEFALLLGTEQDHVLLKQAPDPDFLDHLRELGFQLPTVLVPAHQRPERSVTEDALADPETCAALTSLAVTGSWLSPHGVSEHEQRLAAGCGLPLTGPDAATCKAVNSKVYSRRLADQHGIRQPAGWACSTLSEWEVALERAEVLLDDGPVVVKEAYGVSGKGIAVVDSVQRLRRLGRLVARQATATGEVAFTVERWLDKDRDLNYQLIVARDGTISFDFVKEALTAGGVHRGHRFPAAISPAHHGELLRTADIVGTQLAADGFFGVVGVDALITTSGTLHPVIEINARSNMSTYQVPLQERLLGSHCAQPTDRQVLARHYPVLVSEPVRYRDVRAALGDAVFDPDRRTGVVVHNFATVNAALGADPDQAQATGRLYVLLVAPDAATVDVLDRRVDAALAGLQAVAA